VSDGNERAAVVQASGNTLEGAWQRGLLELRSIMSRRGLKGRWLRVDWVDGVKEASWGELRPLLARTKRNYFRNGLALDAQFTGAFLEQELNSNAMLYGGNAIEHAVVNEKNFMAYAKKKYGSEFSVDFADAKGVFIFSTRGVFCGDDGQLHELNGAGLEAGRRRIDRLSEADVLALIKSSSAYLARQVKTEGRFVYGYHPCFDRSINTYNTLRHASTTYSMIEAWEQTKDGALKAAIDRSLDYLTRNLIRTIDLPDGTQVAYLVDTGDEVKLGGNAVAILALAKYSEVTGERDFLPLLEKLALGICRMQDPQSGSFVHVLNFPSLTVKEPFRTIYYEGEAAFGLMRLYRLTNDRRWLETVEKAFEHFITNDYWKHHDHWLSYCVNELTRVRPKEEYFRFGIRNVADYLDFVIERITTFPTLLELMMAAWEMLVRIDEHPELRHLLAEIDLVKFRKALDHRAHYLLNGHFWPEMAMFFQAPDKIVGSFFIRHHAFRVRIDDVEHYLSGLIAYKRSLQFSDGFDRLVSRHSRANMSQPLAGRLHSHQATSPTWTASQIETATGGTWICSPPDQWLASGLCTYAPAMQPGNMVVMRGEKDAVGIVPHMLPKLGHRPAGIMTTDPAQVSSKEIPILQVGDLSEAVLAMARYARSQMTGKVFAVTGSAGKTTTVAMLSHVLKTYGTVYKSAHNANLPHGVAWNLASAAWTTDSIVLELAVGRMAVSSRLAKPNIALFTNIFPAHLDEKSTVRDIARTKSAIFLGMSPGDVAVLNRDMLEWDTISEAARARNLTILRYGTADDCEFRLVSYDSDQNLVTAQVLGRSIQYRMGAAGSHMALNSLAVLAAVSAAGHSLDAGLAQFASFSALDGRGEVLELSFEGKHLRIIDESYNANPGSMRAALERLSQERSARRVAVLGQMAELGSSAEAYHSELASFIADSSIDRVFVVGELYATFWDSLPDSRKARWASSLEELKSALQAELIDGDVVLFKGSNNTGIHKLVDWMKESSKPVLTDIQVTASS
jgi:UDP-N-acetylmuramoyl-tripeptide--D-alanyl-D-alanine ligase